MNPSDCSPGSSAEQCSNAEQAYRYITALTETMRLTSSAMESMAAALGELTKQLASLTYELDECKKACREVTRSGRLQ